MSLATRFNRSASVSAILGALATLAAYPLLVAQQPPTDPNSAAPNAAAGGGYPGEMGGYGGTGGYDGGMGGYGGESLQFTILDGKNEVGNEGLKVRTASRVKRFSYQLGSLKPQELQGSGNGGSYAGGGGMGGTANGSAGGYGGGMDGSGFGGDMSGGMSGGMYGDMSGGMYGGGEVGSAGMMGGSSTSNGSPRTRIISIHAYILEVDQENNRTKIELLTQPPANAAQAQAFPGMPGGSGGAAGMPGGMGSGGSMMAAGMSGAMSGGGAGMGYVPRLVRLATLVGEGTGTSDKLSMSQAEYMIVANTIMQKIWKADAVKQLNAEQGNAAETESSLKQLLTEEYDTQLARQEIEIESIQQRITKLKDEITRRRAAKERVIDVQLGRIVLEAQGLLGK